MTDKTSSVSPLSQKFYRNKPLNTIEIQGNDRLSAVDRDEQECGNNRNNKKKGFSADWLLNGYETALPPKKQGFQQVSKPKAFFQPKTREPSPPPVLTGFCSIKDLGPIKASGEPSPQDFLGEADLPYPLPTSLQERQTRQRKRAEQLRQLKIREEGEARENWRRVRRRRASFTGGIGMHSSLSSSPMSTVSPAVMGASLPTRSLSMSLSSSPSFSRSLSRLPLVSLSSPLSTKTNSHPRLGNQLKRCPSSPVKSATARKPRRCVGFDLRRTKVFEYEAGEEVCLSRPSSPVQREDGEKGYFDLRPRSCLRRHDEEEDEEED
ncbi:hypothetical protein BGZ54_003872 [Gamsiella multidivaricata]|nr:hypothetical protein BGZ54_003872 [Gamsiella multidivaricata]